METKSTFPNLLQNTPVLPVDTTKITISTPMSPKKDWVESKLMIIVPNWIKQNNQQEVDKSFQKILDTINRMI